MRRILIIEQEGGWTFARADGTKSTSATPFLASIQAHSYGESLRGIALGYIIRLLPTHADHVGEYVTLHQQIF